MRSSSFTISRRMSVDVVVFEDMENLLFIRLRPASTRGLVHNTWLFLGLTIRPLLQQAASAWRLTAKFPIHFTGNEADRGRNLRARNAYIQMSRAITTCLSRVRELPLPTSF